MSQHLLNMISWFSPCLGRKVLIVNSKARTQISLSWLINGFHFVDLNKFYFDLDSLKAPVEVCAMLWYACVTCKAKNWYSRRDTRCLQLILFSPSRALSVQFRCYRVIMISVNINLRFSVYLLLTQERPAQSFLLSQCWDFESTWGFIENCRSSTVWEMDISCFSIIHWRSSRRIEIDNPKMNCSCLESERATTRAWK